jgi:hypothetical protein
MNKTTRDMHAYRQILIKQSVRNVNVYVLNLCISFQHSICKSSSSYEDFQQLSDGQEANWEVIERILFVYAKLNPGHGYVQVTSIDFVINLSIEASKFILSQLNAEYIDAATVANNAALLM